MAKTYRCVVMKLDTPITMIYSNLKHTSDSLTLGLLCSLEFTD
jgi:hypothetical protein